MLVLVEDVAGIDFVGDIGEIGAGAVGEDGLCLTLEFGKVVYNL